MDKDTRCLAEGTLDEHELLEADLVPGQYQYTAINYREWNWSDKEEKNLSSGLKVLRVKLDASKRDALNRNIRELVDKADKHLPAGAIGGPPLPFDPALVSPRYVSMYRKFDQQVVARADKPDDAIFVKRSIGFDWANPSRCQEYRTWIDAEVRVLEKLSRTPHPNIVAYHGCVVEDGLIVGIALEKCVKDLSERLRDTSTPLDIDKCLAQVAAALIHIHGLGYCHNDIKPHNIMVRADDSAALIDFDSCLPVAELLDTGKGTTPLWGDSAAKTSCLKNDWLGLALVEEYMHDPTADKWGDFKLALSGGGGRNGGSGGIGNATGSGSGNGGGGGGGGTGSCTGGGEKKG